jgi:hypothetical protein
MEANLVAHGLGKAFQHSAMVIQHAESFSHLCLDAREPLGSFAFKLKVATLKLQVLTLKLDVISVSFRHPSQKRRLVLNQRGHRFVKATAVRNSTERFLNRMVIVGKRRPWRQWEVQRTDRFGEHNPESVPLRARSLPRNNSAIDAGISSWKGLLFLTQFFTLRKAGFALNPR